MKCLQVVRAGPWASLQDAGRRGVGRLGLTQGGPADLHAWAWANQLVGNAWGTAAIEILFGGLELEAQGTTWACLTGADLGACLDNQPLPLWQAFLIKEGQKLSLQTPQQGLRAYLAVAGGFQGLPQVLGSSSCVTREGLGGHLGRGQLLRAGDQLKLSEVKTRPPQPLTRPSIPDYRQTPTLQLLPGAQIRYFSGASLFAAFNHEWQVDQRADRMGIRLLGPRLHYQGQAMISEAISLGGVQVPPDGQPFVLLNDRQTLGGYPRLGNLTPLACARLAQCPPGQRLRFQAKGLGQAQQEYRAFRAQFNT